MTKARIPEVWDSLSGRLKTPIVIQMRPTKRTWQIALAASLIMLLGIGTLMRNTVSIVILGISFVSQSMFAQEKNEYYCMKTVHGTFSEVTTKVKAEFKSQNFGVITEIDMDAKLKDKLGDVDMMPYKILGVCNPEFVYQSIQIEKNKGLFLPCKVLIKDLGNGKIEVVMVNPEVLMGMPGDDKLVDIAKKVSAKFLVTIEKL